jgi:hypothetical protein
MPDTSSLTLFGCPNSRSMRAAWALEEAGARYEYIKVDLRKGEGRTPQFLAVNPGGKVPALVDDSVVVTESGAIVTHIGERFPASGLVPPLSQPGLRAAYFGPSPNTDSHCHPIGGFRPSKPPPPRSFSAPSMSPSPGLAIAILPSGTVLPVPTYSWPTSSHGQSLRTLPSKLRRWRLFSTVIGRARRACKPMRGSVVAARRRLPERAISAAPRRSQANLAA